jgi:hypothetical protein
MNTPPQAHDAAAPLNVAAIDLRLAGALMPTCGGHR